MEYDESDFTFIDRYRPILFDRDCNSTLDRTESTDDLILFLRAGVEKDEANRFIASLNRRKRSDFIDGWQQGLWSGRRPTSC